MKSFYTWLESFITAKGSFYQTSGEGTIRTKNSLGRGQGEIHKVSSRTVYVTPKQSETLREMLQDYAMNSTYKASIRSVGEVVGLVVKNRQTGQREDSLCRVIRHEKEPKIGLCPIEIWDKDASGEYGFHLGHPIIKLL